MKAVGWRKSRKGVEEKKKKTPVSLFAQIMRRRVIKLTPDPPSTLPLHPSELPHHRLQRKTEPAVNIWANVESLCTRNWFKKGRERSEEGVMRMRTCLLAPLLCLYGSRRPVHERTRRQEGKQPVVPTPGVIWHFMNRITFSPSKRIAFFLRRL